MYLIVFLLFHSSMFYIIVSGYLLFIDMEQFRRQGSLLFVNSNQLNIAYRSFTLPKLPHRHPKVVLESATAQLQLFDEEVKLSLLSVLFGKHDEDNIFVAGEGVLYPPPSYCPVKTIFLCEFLFLCFCHKVVSCRVSTWRACIHFHAVYSVFTRWVSSRRSVGMTSRHVLCFLRSAKQNHLQNKVPLYSC